MFLWYWSVTHLMEFLSQRYTHRILQTSVVVKDSCYVPEIQYGYIECLVKLSASDIYHGDLEKHSTQEHILLVLYQTTIPLKHLNVPILNIVSNTNELFCCFFRFCLILLFVYQGPSWLWSYGSWIYSSTFAISAYHQVLWFPPPIKWTSLIKIP
jgi:hypothetical protein